MAQALLRKRATMRRIGWLAIIATFGCVTPSIPIPPPDPSRMNFSITAQGADSTAVLTYPPDPNYEGGIVYVFNHDTGRGVFENVNADNSIGPTQPLQAAVGHQLVISVEHIDQTASRCIVLREGPQDPNTYCSF